MQRNPDKFWNPYLAGVALGPCSSRRSCDGQGLGASGASLRAGIAALDLVAPGHVASTPAARARCGERARHLARLRDLGALLGGVVAAYTSGG